MNLAAKRGPATFDWWPDWRGDTVAILANGPSLKGTDLSPIRGHLRVLAIKQSIDLCPWADVVYGCDAPWWQHRHGLTGFPGLRLAYEVRALTLYSHLKRVEIEKTTDRLLFDEPAKVGSGGNSGFHALNLAVQFGAVRILLIGFDMSDRAGVHWYGRNNWPGANNPMAINFSRWIAAFTTAAEQLRQMDVEVVNASPISAMKCFPRRSIVDTLQGWE